MTALPLGPEEYCIVCGKPIAENCVHTNKLHQKLSKLRALVMESPADRATDSWYTETYALIQDIIGGD